MAAPRCRASWIVRVMECRGGCCIVVLDLRGLQRWEFGSWESAMAFVRAASEREGLR